MTSRLPDDVGGILGRLAEAVGADELIAATGTPAADGHGPDGAGVRRRLANAGIAIDERRLPSTIPRVELTLERFVDARELMTAWQVEAPVAVATDAHQRHWELRR